MSWEDCGFKPGKVNGPTRCSRQCDACDGEHHFLIDSSALEEDPDEEPRFICKHCGVTADMVDEDDEEPQLAPE